MNRVRISENESGSSEFKSTPVTLNVDIDILHHIHPDQQEAAAEVNQLLSYMAY